MKETLTEGLDYYIDELGRWVFSRHYLVKRGYCCKNGCRHCPFGYSKNLKTAKSKTIRVKISKNHPEKG